MIRTFADRVILADGWARAFVALLSGAVGALAMPPFGIWPALFVSCPVAIWLIDGSGAGDRFRHLASLRRAALAGWLWGFGYFVAGLWWLGSAFLVEPDKYALLLPFGVLGLPAYLAFYPAVGFALARLLWSRSAWRILAFGLGLALADWLRGHVFTGFPWNAFGLALGQNLWLMQTASLVGMYGLSAIAAVIFAAPATLADDEGTGQWLPVGLAALAIVAMAAYGAQRIPADPVASVPGVKLRLVQPNLPQDAKFKPSAGPQILADYLALSDRATAPGASGLADVTHVIWPESAFPFLLHRAPDALARIAAALPQGGTLITGAARREDGMPPDGRARYFNAIQAVAKSGAITATYDKVHLVPFGEYVPVFVEGLLERLGIGQFVHIPGGFSAGERRAALRIEGLPPVAATVCYEAIFPDEIAPEGRRAGLILNVTNDGWFGDTPGPRQHFAQARLRAVEQGLPLVRAANTGISAVTDPYGRIVGTLPVGVAATLDSGLPTAIGPTPYSRFGNAVFAMLCTVYGLGALFGRRTDRRWGRERI